MPPLLIGALACTKDTAVDSGAGRARGARAPDGIDDDCDGRVDDGTGLIDAACDGLIDEHTVAYDDDAGGSSKDEGDACPWVGPR